MEVITGSIEERIINASFQILEKEGISKTTTKKIAERAGVSEVTLFRKFKNKQNLIELSKDYYCEYLIKNLEDIFEFEKNISVEEYLKTRFEKFVNLTDHELNTIKIGIEEVRDIPTEYKLYPRITDTIQNKLSEFFALKIKQNKIRAVNPDILALNLCSILIETIILWKVYGKTPKYNINQYIDDFLDIILNGIKCD